MSEAHSPLPWSVEPGEGIRCSGTSTRVHHPWVTRNDGDDSFAPEDDDAAFIVTACNSHDALLEALKAAATDSGVSTSVREWCKTAIAQAEGRS